MTAIVLDASVVLKWFLPEAESEAAIRLRELEVACEAPDLLLLEVANALWKHVQRGTIEASMAAGAVSALAEAPIGWRAAETLFQHAFDLAIQTGRTVYDCAYLALAIESGNPLVTADRRFYDAVKTGPLAAHMRWLGDIA